MAETKRQGRGVTRPLQVRLAEKVETERGRVQFHEKHLADAKASLRAAESAARKHEKAEKSGASEKIAEYEAELKRLRSLV